MKTRSLLLSLLIVLSGAAGAKELDYGLVLTAGTGVIDGRVVRYLTVFKEPCLIVQNLVPGDVGSVVNESRICGLSGRGFSEDFADFSFERGVFEKGGLFFEVIASPVKPIGEKKLYCEVKFSGASADHLSCKSAQGEE